MFCLRVRCGWGVKLLENGIDGGHGVMFYIALGCPPVRTFGLLPPKLVEVLRRDWCVHTVIGRAWDKWREPHLPYERFLRFASHYI